MDTSNSPRLFEKPMGASVTTILRFHAKHGSENITSNVDCSGCNSQCCRHYEVFCEKGDDPSLFTGISKETGEPILPRNEDGSCSHLTENGCGIYDRRPKTCRSYDCRPYAIAGVLDRTQSSGFHFNYALLQWDVASGVKTLEDVSSFHDLRAKVTILINGRGMKIQDAVAAAARDKVRLTDVDGVSVNDLKQHLTASKQYKIDKLVAYCRQHIAHHNDPVGAMVVALSNPVLSLGLAA